MEKPCRIRVVYMKGKKIVIIGFGAGGFSALMAAKKTSRDVQVTIIEKRNYDMFSPCGLPFVIEGTIQGTCDLIHQVPTGTMGAEKLLEHEVKSIDVKNKTISVIDLSNGSNKLIEYDTLIIATGSEPFIPPIPGARELIGKGVYTVSCPEDTEKIIEETKVKSRAAVLGAGPIGLEVASALRARGLEVAVVEMLDWVFPKALDRDMAALVEKSLKAQGIQLYLGRTLDKVNGEDHIHSAVVGGQTLEADILVAASGVRADLLLARNAGIEVGRFGITTNMRMMTSVRDIYAVGDCAEVVNPLTHRPWVSQLSNSAYLQGKVAGTNAAGGYATYEGSYTTFVSVVGGLEVAATGLNSYFAGLYGFNVIGTKAKGKTRPEWYPGSEDITVKVLADSASGKLLGAQAVGPGAAARINVVAAALKGRLTVHELAEVELAYCPAISETYDVLTKACDHILRKSDK